jgi:hypothetical protein
MKKILAFLILSLVVVSCYDDYVVDYDWNGVYFVNPINVRTLVVGEGMKIKVGAQIGGILENKIDRNVNFVIDNSLITPSILAQMKNHPWQWVSEPSKGVTTLQPLPSNYYTLSDPGKIVIKKGWHSGYVTLEVDQASFLADHPGTLEPIYAVSFYITSADADSILTNNRSTIIGLRYEHMLFGNYLHGGVTTVKDAGGSTVETISYRTSVSQSGNEIMRLSTVAPDAVVTNGFSLTRTNQQELMLTLNGDNVTIGSAPGSTNTFEADGTSAFNGSKLLQERKLFLNYKYQAGDLTYHCQDTLTFRNRIRDGVNEWQDENPDNYK